MLPAGARLVEVCRQSRVILQNTDPGFKTCFPHEGLPLGTVGFGPAAMEPMHGHMGQLMAEDFLQETGLGFGESGEVRRARSEIAGLRFAGSRFAGPGLPAAVQQTR